MTDTPNDNSERREPSGHDRRSSERAPGYAGDPGARKGLLNEAMLCDLIEGQLSEAKADSARGILARDPVLGQTLAQIEHDRDMLRSLGDQMCPADMFSRLEPLLEREMLLEQEAHESSPVNLRKAPGVVVRQQRTWRIPAAVFAAAAGLAVVSGVVIFAQQFMAKFSTVSPTRVATDQPTNNAGAPLDATAAPVVAPEPVQLAAEATTPAATPALIDQPIEALQLAQAGRAQFRVAGMAPASARTALAAINKPDQPWRFEGLRSDGPVFCMVEPRSEAWTSLTTALRNAGFDVSLEAIEANKAEPVEIVPERVLWWEHRSTWAVQRARVPIAFE